MLARFPHRRSEQGLDSLACLFLCMTWVNTATRAMERCGGEGHALERESQREAEAREEKTEAAVAPGDPS